MDVYYFSLEINIFLTKELSLTSNKLNGFYARARMVFLKQVKSYYDKLVEIDYSRKLDSIKMRNLLKNDDFATFEKEILKKKKMSKQN
jgi:hypothetical protein